MTENKKKSELSARLVDIINENDDFLVITHIFPDGDAIGSITALHMLLSSLGKRSRMICNSDLPYQYRFLPCFNEIKREKEIEDLYEKKFICIVLDCADQQRTEMDTELLKDSGSHIVNIDHHRSNNRFGDLNIIESGKAATSEMIFKFIYKYFKDILDHDIATCLYVGILTDTGRFQYSNTTANVHLITGKLLEYGIYPSEVYCHIYESDPLGRFKLIQKVFDRIEYIEPLCLIYSYVLEEDFTKLKISFYAQDGVIELLRSAEGTRVAALIKQIENNSYKVSLRTSDRQIDLSAIASGFGGGGHRAASAYRDEGKLDKVISRLKSAVRKEIGDARYV